MDQWQQRMKERRMQQLERLKGKLKSVSTSSRNPFFMDFAKHRSTRFLVQAVLAAALFLATTIGYQHDTSRAWIQTVWSKEFQFSKARELYERYLGGEPTVLPSFSYHGKQKESPWLVPVKGKIVLPFTPERKGIVLETAQPTQVIAPADGRVIFVGQKKNLGQTVAIRYPGVKELWISLLDQVKIKEKDWVQRGQILGLTSERNGKYFVYLSIKKQGQYIDPAGVMVFE